METKTMETKTGHFIDKNYLEKSFINYDKDFLLRKYFLKSDGKKIEDALEEIEAGIIESTNKAKFNKYYLESIEGLPDSPEAADYNGIYIVLDSKSSNAECECFLYSVVEVEEGRKEWMVLSAPSYLFETENIDYDKEFLKYERKNMLSESKCFVNFNGLFQRMKNLAKQNSDGRWYWNFYRNSEYNYEYLNISVTSDTAKYKSNDKADSDYIDVSSNELDAFAQTIFNYVEGK